MKWPLVSLSQISKTQYGYTASAEDFEVGPRYLRITDIAGGPIDWASVPFCKISETDYPKYKLAVGDIVIARTGNTTGYAKLIRQDNKAVFASYLVRLKLKSDVADPGCVGRLIESDIYKRFVKSIKSGAAQGNANATTLTLFRFNLPPLEVQKEITSKLSYYDDFIDTNRQRIQLLEESARLLFREWFVYFRFPGHEKVKMVDGVPEGWKKEQINKFVSFKRGVEPGSDNYLETHEPGSFPFYRVSDLVTRNPSIFVDEQYARNALLNKSDIVISLDGSVGIVSIGLEGCYSTGIRKLVIRDKKVNRAYLYCLMQSYYVQGIINAYAKGTTIQHAGEAIKHMNPVLPSQGLMGIFGEMVNPIIDEVLNLLDQNQKLAQARDLLLPRLMSGEIEV